MSELTRVAAEIDVWGTILYVETASSSVGASELNAGIEELKTYVKKVDEIFSPFKSESEVSKLRRKEIAISEASPEMQEIWQLCLTARELTNGAFDPWAVKKGFDPSGYVKGWAADHCIAILKNHGAEHVQINAAGDLSLFGGVEPGQPWSIGIRDPENKFKVVKVFEITSGAVATSGQYEIGAHIINPRDGLIAIGAASATVMGPDGGLADALATALMVDGKDGAGIFMKPELREYSAWVIERHSDTAWTIPLDR